MTVAVFVLQLVALVVLVVTMLVIGRQTSEARRAAYAQAFGVVFQILQEQSVRDARRVVLRSLTGMPVEEWTEAEIQSAEIVCATYDTAAIMCRHGMLPVDVLADSWGDSIRRSWVTLEPLVSDYRAKRDANELWDDFQWLALEAEAFVHHRHFQRLSALDRVRSRVANVVAGADHPVTSIRK